jgi:hypothetical protein
MSLRRWWWCFLVECFDLSVRWHRFSGKGRMAPSVRLCWEPLWWGVSTGTTGQRRRRSPWLCGGPLMSLVSMGEGVKAWSPSAATSSFLACSSSAVGMVNSCRTPPRRLSSFLFEVYVVALVFWTSRHLDRSGVYM